MHYGMSRHCCIRVDRQGLIENVSCSNAGADKADQKDVCRMQCRSKPAFKSRASQSIVLYGSGMSLSTLLLKHCCGALGAGLGQYP